MIDVRYPTALQIVLSLAVARERGMRCTSAELAKGLGTNPVLVRKLLVPLVRDGIVISTTGKSGGVKLGRAPEDITLLDVYRSAVEEKRLFAIRTDGPALCVVSRNIGRFLDGLRGEAEHQFSTLLAGRTVAQGLAALRTLDAGQGQGQTAATAEARLQEGPASP